MKPVITPLLTVLLLGLVPACDEPGDGITDPQSPGWEARDDAGALVSLNRAIPELIEALDAAWAAKDAAAYAALFTSDAEFVSPPGAILVGRDAIRAQHAFLFSGPFAGTTETRVLRRKMVLGGDKAIVDLDVRLTGFLTPPALPQVEPGVVQTRVKLLLVKRANGWRILTQQMTAVAPAPV